MKRYIVFIVLAISVTLTISCSHNESQKHSTKELASNPKSGHYSEHRSIMKEHVYYFDDTVVLIGKLGKEMFFGPPGYGENPKTDKKEIEPILYLNKKINVQDRDSSGSGDDSDLKLNETKKMQVILGLGVDFKEADKFYGQRVAIRGQLMEWETGHHHTPVLIIARQMLPSK